MIEAWFGIRVDGNADDTAKHDTGAKKIFSNSLLLFDARFGLYPQCELRFVVSNPSLQTVKGLFYA